MSEVPSNVRGLKEFFDNKIRANSQSKEFNPKNKNVTTSPQIKQNEQESILQQINDDELPEDIQKLKEIVSKLKYDLNKLNCELREARGVNNKMINHYQELQAQASRYPMVSQKNQELEQQNAALKARLMLAQEKIEQQQNEQESITLPKFNQQQQLQQSPQQNKYNQQYSPQQYSPQQQQQQQQQQIQKHQSIQVDLIQPILEQNQLLLERLNEKKQPQGKELIIINTTQSFQLKQMMEELKIELVQRLNHYNELISNKQLNIVKKDIKIDIPLFHEKYIQMFISVNRPIENVNQIGKILSPSNQSELNEFLATLSSFLDKFSSVANI